MCMFAAALPMISTVLSAAGSLASGYQQKKMADFQADEANYQASVERDNAKAEAEKIRTLKERQRGSARAALAGAGVDVGDGSAVVIDEDISTRYEQDAFAALLTGDRRGRAMNNQASMYKTAGKNAMWGGVVDAGKSVLGSAMKYSQWRAA